MSEFKIENISDETKNKIKLLSAYSLPNNPSERGMTPEQIKKRFYDPILSSAASALGEIDRVILEANRILAELVQRADGAAETANDAKLNAEGAESAAEKAEENAKQAEAEAAESKTAAEDAVANALAAKEAAEAAETAVLGLEVLAETGEEGSFAFAQAELADGKIVIKLTIPRGAQGVQGVQGKRGEGFDIKKVYASIEDMEAGYSADGLTEGQFVLVRPEDENTEDYGKLYVKGGSEYLFVVDMSVSVKGDQGEPGYTPVRGVDYWTEEDQSAMAAFINTKMSLEIPKEVSEQLGVIENGSY